MRKHSFTAAGFAVLLALGGISVAHAQSAAPAKGTAKGAAAPAAAPAAPAASAPVKELYPKAQYDFMLKERLAAGQPDTPELHNAIRDELNTRELLVREAKKKGLDKSADIQMQMDLAAQTVLVRDQMTVIFTKDSFDITTEVIKRYNTKHK